jgi:hypothetical protein
MSNQAQSVIWKFPFPLQEEEFTLDLPAVRNSPKPLLVGLDSNGVGCMWFLVNPDSVKRPTKFFVRGTGFTVPPDVDHMGSFITPGGFVWHIFRELA